MAKYYEESPEITKYIDWDTILGRVPSTNIGMVPFQYESIARGVPQLGLPNTFVDKTGYVGPRDWKVKDLLGYSAYDRNRYGELVPKQIEYDRPEELEFGRDPNEPIPGVYNTELNPYDPSSKFFPYEKDFSGIMATTALKESGDPIYDIARAADVTDVPPSFRGDAEYIRPGSEKRYGVTSTWPPPDAPERFAVGLNIPDLREDKGYIDSTLLHEARHYYQSKYGFDITQLSGDEMHNVIRQFQGIYSRPDEGYQVDQSNIPFALTKKEADAYMGMHKQGKQWYENQGQGFPLSKAEIKQKKQQESQALWDRREAYHGLMMAGQESLGQTHDQRMKQFNRMYDYDTSQRRGDYTRPTMTQQQMGREAQVTGGRVNPHEATKAAYQQQGPAGGPRPHFNEGGIAGLPGQWTPSISESEEEIYDIKPLQLDPGIMSIEDLEDLFEEVGLDKSIIYKLINSGGLSQLVA